MHIHFTFAYINLIVCKSKCCQKLNYQTVLLYSLFVNTRIIINSKFKNKGKKQVMSMIKSWLSNEKQIIDLRRRCSGKQKHARTFGWKTEWKWGRASPRCCFTGSMISRVGHSLDTPSPSEYKMKPLFGKKGGALNERSGLCKSLMFHRRVKTNK